MSRVTLAAAAALLALMVGTAGPASAQSTTGVERSGGSWASPPPATGGPVRSGSRPASSATGTDMDPTIYDVYKSNDAAAARLLTELYENLEPVTEPAPAGPVDASAPDHGNGNP